MIRIARLDLERWGHFEGRSLTFGAAGRLHVVYGDNEAGKSTTRRAVSALLFGVPSRTVDRRERAGGDLRVGGLLELDGRSHELVRRKGIKDTLLDSEGMAMDPAPLEQALGTLTGKVHAGLFEVTHTSLVEGGEELLAGRGAVGESLFAAGAGTSRLQRLLRALEDEADAIFRPRGRTLELNQALAGHADAVKALRAAGLRPPEHDRLAAELQELETAVEAAGTELGAAEREIARLERLRGALPLVSRHAARLREREALGAVPVLAPNATARREAAEARRDDARARTRAAEQAIARCRLRLEALDVDDELLARADDVLALHARAAAVRDAAAARSGLVAQLAEEDAALRALLAALEPALGGRSLDALALDDTAREQLDRCLEARAGAEQGASAAQAAAEDARTRAGTDAEALRQAPAPVDDAALTAALRAARPAAAAEPAAAAARAEERGAVQRAEREVARLRPAAGSATALATVPVPAADTLDGLLARHAELATAAQRLDDEARRSAEDRDGLEAERIGLAGAAALPDPSTLLAARAQRDARWAEVRGALTEPVAEPEALAVAFEAAQAGADAIADQRLQRADDVARVAAVDQRLSALDRRQATASRRRTRHERDVAALAADWAAAWEAAGALAPTLADAPGWLAGRDAVSAHLAAAEDAARRAQAGEDEAARHRAALAEALRTSGATIGAITTLAGLIEQADAHADALRERSATRERLGEAARRSAAAARDAERERERAEGALATWRASWEGLREACGLDAALSPDDALGALRRLADASAREVRVGELRRELAALDARAEQFATDVRALCGDVAADLRDAAPAAAVGTLQQRVADARAAHQERVTLGGELAADEDDLAGAREDAAAAEAGLAVLREAAGAEDDAALARAEARAARAAALDDELAELAAEIAAAGGAALEDVVAAVSALDADAVPARVEELTGERDALRARRDAAREALTRARDELARLERSDEAARAAQAAAGHLAKVRDLAERYARARLAQRLLRDAIERYRREHEGPMLARANALFPALTCGAFTRLVTELDEQDAWVLIAVTAAGVRKRVEELSDGTREQLFLALRLAAIERYVEVAGPMPVVFDDVLLESDDDRATQVLSVLGDLARQTQVILLTHHRHLVEIARAAVGDDRLDLLELRDDVAVAEDIASGAIAVDDDADDADAALPAAGPMVSLADELEAVLAGGGGGTLPGPGEQGTLL